MASIHDDSGAAEQRGFPPVVPTVIVDPRFYRGDTGSGRPVPTTGRNADASLDDDEFIVGMTLDVGPEWADESGVILDPERPCPTQALEGVYSHPGVVQSFRGRMWLLRPALPFLQPKDSEDYATPEFYSNGLLRVTLVEFPISRGHGGTSGGRAWGYVDRDGVVVIPPKFRYAGTFSEGLAAVQPLGQDCFGFVDTTGELVIPCEHSGPAYFSEGVAFVDGGYIDRTGAWFIAPRFEAAGAFRGGRAVVWLDDRRGIVDRGGRVTGLRRDSALAMTEPDDYPAISWPSAFWRARQAGASEDRRVRGDQCTFVVTDDRGRAVFDHILLDPAWLAMSG